MPAVRAGGERPAPVDARAAGLLAAFRVTLATAGFAGFVFVGW